MNVRNRCYREPTGALSLTGIENMSESEKTERIKAVTNDMAASIIYVAKHAEAGNVTADQIKPLYDIFADISRRERTEREKLMCSLEEMESQVEDMKRQHRRDIDELIKAAAAELKKLKREMGRAGPDEVPLTPAKTEGPKNHPVKNDDDEEMTTVAEQPADDTMDMSADGAEEVDENASQASSRTLSAASSAD